MILTPFPDTTTRHSVTNAKLAEHGPTALTDVNLVKIRSLAVIAVMLLRPALDAIMGSPCLLTSFNAPQTPLKIVPLKYPYSTKTDSYGARPARPVFTKDGLTNHLFLKDLTLLDVLKIAQILTKAVQNAQSMGRHALNASMG